MHMAANKQLQMISRERITMNISVCDSYFLVREFYGQK